MGNAKGDKEEKIGKFRQGSLTIRADTQGTTQVQERRRVKVLAYSYVGGRGGSRLKKKRKKQK